MLEIAMKRFQTGLLVYDFIRVSSPTWEKTTNCDLFISALAVNKCVQGNASRTSDLPPMQHVQRSPLATGADQAEMGGRRSQVTLQRVRALTKFSLCYVFINQLQICSFNISIDPNHLIVDLFSQSRKTACWVFSKNSPVSKLAL